MAYVLSNLEIESMVDKDPLFKGVKMNQEPLKQIKKPGYYILNLQNKHENGSHWVLCYTHPTLGIIYSDSFGLPPTKYISNCIRHTHLPCFLNSYKYQSLHASTCGYFCMITAQLLHTVQDTDALVSLFDTTLMKVKRFLDTVEGTHDAPTEINWEKMIQKQH